MDAHYDDRLILPNISPASETVALPNSIAAIPILLVAIFILFSVYSVNTIRKSIALKGMLGSPETEDLEKVFSSVSESKAIVIDGDPQPGLSTVFTSDVIRWRADIGRWSDKHDLPQDLIAIVMQIESCGNPHARSQAGAIGLFQVMPYHFLLNEDPYEIQTNASRGLDYLSKSYELGGGRIDLALAGYNGGHSQITKRPQQWPEETTRYVRWGAGIWDDIQAAESQSETLELWLDSGGRYLCESNF